MKSEWFKVKDMPENERLMTRISLSGIHANYRHLKRLGNDFFNDEGEMVKVKPTHWRVTCEVCECSE